MRLSFTEIKKPGEAAGLRFIKHCKWSMCHLYHRLDTNSTDNIPTTSKAWLKYLQSSPLEAPSQLLRIRSFSSSSSISITSQPDSLSFVFIMMSWLAFYLILSWGLHLFSTWIPYLWPIEILPSFQSPAQFSHNPRKFLRLYAFPFIHQG